MQIENLFFTGTLFATKIEHSLQIFYVTNRKWCKHTAGVINPIISNVLVSLLVAFYLRSISYNNLRKVSIKQTTNVCLIWIKTSIHYFWELRDWFWSKNAELVVLPREKSLVQGNRVELNITFVSSNWDACTFFLILMSYFHRHYLRSCTCTLFSYVKNVCVNVIPRTKETGSWNMQGVMFKGTYLIAACLLSHSTQKLFWRAVDNKRYLLHYQWIVRVVLASLEMLGKQMFVLFCHAIFLLVFLI
jgi:hypothetical protein